MQRRFMTIWFPHLMTDWMEIKNPELKGKSFVIVVPDRGRMVIVEPSFAAKRKGIHKGMIVTDGKIIDPDMQVINEKPGLSNKLLKLLGKWCIRFTPCVAIDEPNGLILEVTGCTHLWENEENYLTAISERLNRYGYHLRTSISDTIGSAWAICHYGNNRMIVRSGDQINAILQLPPSALRIAVSISEKLHQLGLVTVGQILSISHSALTRRFGNELIKRINETLGSIEEIMEPIIPVEPFEERIYCLEPIKTKTGIEIALGKLLGALSQRLKKEGKGLRKSVFQCYRLDGKIEEISIGTNNASNYNNHLFKLFQEKIGFIEPDHGIELFVLKAPVTERLVSVQQTILNSEGNLIDPTIAQLLDTITNKLGSGIIHRYLPAQHHWPERSIIEARTMKENAKIDWRRDKLRPVQLLPEPHLITVSAPIPDYPPMNFRCNGKLHIVRKADGPERIEREWWIEKGLHRDYYVVEDAEGKRYWLFRLGHYNAENKPKWFLHGYFA